jgi:hypothetical protein
MLSNYPDGMTRSDLIYVGEISPDYCEECFCADPDDPWPVDEDGAKCHHREVCGCDQCECSCHADDFDPPDDWDGDRVQEVDHLW